MKSGSIIPPGPVFFLKIIFAILGLLYFRTIFFFVPVVYKMPLVI